MPLNASAFTQVVQGKAGEVLPGLFRVRDPLPPGADASSLPETFEQCH
jgi:hypothetical protein